LFLYFVSEFGCIAQFGSDMIFPTGLFFVDCAHDESCKPIGSD